MVGTIYHSAERSQAANSGSGTSFLAGRVECASRGTVAHRCTSSHFGEGFCGWRRCRHFCGSAAAATVCEFFMRRHEEISTEPTRSDDWPEQWRPDRLRLGFRHPKQVDRILHLSSTDMRTWPGRIRCGSGSWPPLPPRNFNITSAGAGQ
jgi:hypothetical protein